MAILFYLLTQISFSFPLCNGGESLCTKRYDQVVFPTTHNATAVRSGKGMVWFVPNQEKNISQQLKDGIRAFMIDTMFYDGIKKKEMGKVYNCHSTCKLGGRPLLEALNQIQDFLKNHPNEIITLILENYVPHQNLFNEFNKSGLLPNLYSHDVEKDWPTLGLLIENNKRLIVFTDSQEENSPLWLHHMWTHMVETKYTYKKIKDYDCDFNRGQKENKLFILNHFLTKALFRRAHNRKSNRLDILLKRARRCQRETGKIPNFFTVDFYKTGDIVQASSILNQENF